MAKEEIQKNSEHWYEEWKKLKVQIEKLKYKEENYLQKIEHKDEVIKTLQNRIEKMKCCGNCSHRHYWGNELGCNLDLDKQFECDNNNKKYWEFRKE